MDTLELSLSDQLLTQEDVVKWVERLCWTDMKGKGGTKLTVDREQVLPGSLCYVTRKWRGHWLKQAWDIWKERPLVPFPPKRLSMVGVPEVEGHKLPLKLKKIPPGVMHCISYSRRWQSAGIEMLIAGDWLITVIIQVPHVEPIE